MCMDVAAYLLDHYLVFVRNIKYCLNVILKMDTLIYFNLYRMNTWKVLPCTSHYGMTCTARLGTIIHSRARFIFLLFIV